MLLHTPWGGPSTSQVIEAFYYFHLLSTCGGGHPHPVPPPLGTSCFEQVTYFFYNFVVKNVFCQYLYTI